MADSQHIALPKNTPAYICADCGAVSLDPQGICKVQGMGTKNDWCGVKASRPPASCHAQKNNDRWQCRNCGMTAVNPGLLCEPEQPPSGA